MNFDDFSLRNPLPFILSFLVTNDLRSDLAKLVGYLLRAFAIKIQKILITT
jgi:hypothetical protein